MNEKQNLIPQWSTENDSGYMLTCMFNWAIVLLKCNWQVDRKKET